MNDVLPIALGIAASPFPVIPAILLLFAPRAKVTTAAFLAGWALGVLAVTTAFTLLAEVIDGWDETPTWASWARVILGTLLVVVGLVQWIRRDSEEPTEPAWMASLATATPSSAARLALLLSAANPKILLLAAAGGLAIGAAGLPASTAAVWVVAFTAVASLTVALPLVLYLVAGERVLGPLGRAKDWLTRNNAAVMAVVIVVIGVVVLVAGATSL